MPDFEFDSATHIFTQGGIVKPSVTFVLASAGICDFSFVEQGILERTKIRGKSVHWLLELEDQGALNYRRVPRPLRGYRKAYIDWKKRSQFFPVLIEKKFVSHYGYAGIVDRAGTFPVTPMFIGGSTAILDFKTGGIADWVRYQLAAYAVGIEPNFSVARTIRRVALALNADGTAMVREFEQRTFDSDFAKFYDAMKGVALA